MESSADSEQAFRPGDGVAGAFLRAWARWQEGVRAGWVRGERFRLRGWAIRMGLCARRTRRLARTMPGRRRAARSAHRRASGGTQHGARTCAFVAGRAAHVDICAHKNERRCINTGRKNGRRAASVLKLCGLPKVNDRKMQNISARIHLHHKKRAPRGRKARFNRIIIDKAGQR